MICRLWSNQLNRTNKDRILNLITALVDFQKCQCYFILAIEVATLVLVARGSVAVEKGGVNIDFAPTYDVMFTIPLAMSGFVPVIFALVCISHYGRLSAPHILLSVLAVVVSTISLAMTGHILSLFANDQLSVYDPEYLKWIQSANQMCGASPSKPNTVGYQQIGIRLVWVIYTYCVLWFLWCIFKCLREGPLKNYRGLQICHRWTLGITLSPVAWKFLRTSSWIVCIALW